MYGPQALDMISLELLEAVFERAKEQQTSVHMHIAQGGRERLQIQERYGEDASTVKVLNENKLLSERLIGAHCHDTTAAEKKLLAEKGLKMVGCPSSIGMIDGIVPPVDHFLSLGATVGIGTDQAPGPGQHNLFRELRTISLLTKVMKKDPTALPAWQTLQLVTTGGAKVLGLEQKIGSLEEGKLADIITIDLEQLSLVPVVDHPFRTFIPNLVYTAFGNEVDNVIIHGKIIMENKNFATIDEQSLIKQANKRAQEIFEEAADDWSQANSELVKRTKNGFL
jgi:5-methylthioadenosine/S-adenosylhomocysteine deaminase